MTESLTELFTELCSVMLVEELPNRNCFGINSLIVLCVMVSVGASYPTDVQLDMRATIPGRKLPLETLEKTCLVQTSMTRRRGRQRPQELQKNFGQQHSADLALPTNLPSWHPQSDLPWHPLDRPHA